MSDNLKRFPTRTGCIFVDPERRLEFLYVGDYGQENNIKANFLGFTKEINGVPHEDVDLDYKLVVTISTQKGCPMHCAFCDCPKVKFGGNISVDELKYQVETAIRESGATHTRRLNLHLARMGEPSLNAKNVLNYLQFEFRQQVAELIDADEVHPVFTTMMPKVLGKEKLQEILLDFCDLKNYGYAGEAGLQLSINSTDEEQRQFLFGGQSLTLEEISEIGKALPMPVGRKYTLNFPVTASTILDPARLSELFDKNKFIVKITPIHETHEAIENGITTEMGYYSYDVYKQFEQPLLDAGWDVIVFIPSKEEDEDRITCGNALISQEAGMTK